MACFERSVDVLDAAASEQWKRVDRVSRTELRVRLAPGSDVEMPLAGRSVARVLGGSDQLTVDHVVADQEGVRERIEADDRVLRSVRLRSSTLVRRSTSLRRSSVTLAKR